MVKRVIQIFLFVIVLLSLTSGGCQKGASSKIRAGYVPIADNLQLFVGVEMGFYKEEGIELELYPISSGPKVLEALISSGSDKIDIGFSSIVPTILAKSQGMPVIAIGGGPVETKEHKTHAILVDAKSTIYSGKDLAGKSIAINAFRNIEHVMLNRYLQTIGVDAKNITLVEIPFPQMESVLLGKNVDAVASIEPYLTSAITHGQVRVIDYHYPVVEPRTVVSSYVTTEGWSAENKDTVQRFIRATERATDFIRNNEPQARQILMKYTKIDEETARTINLPEFVAKHDPNDIKKWVDILLEQKLIVSPLESSFIYPQLN